LKTLVIKENPKLRAISYKPRLNQHQSAICAPWNRCRSFKQLQPSFNQWNQRGLFHPRDYLSQNSETDWIMKVCFDCHASVLQTSLKNFA